MSMAEDEALAIYSAAKEQQAAVAAAVVAMNKASADMASRYADFLAALGRVEKVPESALGPIKRTVEASIDAGLTQHLTSKTKALGEALTDAEGRVEAIKDRGILPTVVLSFMAGVVGAGLVIGTQWLMTPTPAAPVVAATQPAPLPMTAEAPVRKQKKQP